MFLIVSGGDAPESVFLSARADSARIIIAADKGARYCLDAGVTPDIVVGDMDSVDAGVLEDLESRGVDIRRFSADKDYTDTQLALDAALKLGAKRIEFIAATGDRFDHGLANFQLLYHALRYGADAWIRTPAQRIFLVEGEHTIAGKKGSTVSVLPLTMKARGIYLHGFRYELDDASMEIGNPYGMSNIVTSEVATVKVGHGVLAVVISPDIVEQVRK